MKFPLDSLLCVVFRRFWMDKKRKRNSSKCSYAQSFCDFILFIMDENTRRNLGNVQKSQ